MYAVRETNGLKIDDGFIAIDLELPNLYSREGSASAFGACCNKVSAAPQVNNCGWQLSLCQGADQNPDNPDNRETRGIQKMSPEAFALEAPFKHAGAPVWPWERYEFEI